MTGPASRANPVAKATGSRRQRKKERTRRQIFGAAMELFEERGLEAVSLEQICERADVARATFFLHFPARSALLVERGRELALELSGRLGEARESAVSELRSVLGALASSPSPALTAAVLRDGGVPVRELLEEIVRRGQRRSELRRDVPPDLASAALLATTAALLGEASGARAPAEIARALASLSLQGLLEPKPRLKWSPARGSGSGRGGA